MNTTHIIFQNTLSGLSQGLQIRHIATIDLQTCAPNDNAARVLELYPEYDQIPVKEDDRIVGLLERDSSRDDFVHNQMRRLDDGILVSAEQPLLDFIPLMANPPYYRLVLSGTRVNGLVTRSDLLKLPVRLLGFAMVTNLEIVMKELIAQQLPADSQWMAYLSEGRQNKIKDKAARFQEKRMDPPLLELTEFCDKKEIIRKNLEMPNEFSSDLAKVEELRNSIAHAGNYASGEAELQAFINNFNRARYWIDELSKKLN